jgi:ubiquinone/menaquinone biosynthesis C-methylase UbiE
MTHDLTNAISYWNENACVWDEAMAEGSAFQKTLVEPSTLNLLKPEAGQTILDLACGNGQMSRVLAALGAAVTAIDGSQNMINLARKRSAGLTIEYRVADIMTTEQVLLEPSSFDAVLCNMALMDIQEIKPVFQIAYRALKKDGAFVFSVTHPCFDKSVGPHITEMHENGGTVLMERSIKVREYLNTTSLKTRALPTLPSAHYFFHRPLQVYLSAAFEEGFSMCGIAEPAFPHDTELKEHKGWHELPGIPVVFIAKFKK